MMGALSERAAVQRFGCLTPSSDASLGSIYIT